MNTYQLKMGLMFFYGFIAGSWVITMLMMAHPWVSL